MQSSASATRDLHEKAKYRPTKFVGFTCPDEAVLRHPRGVEKVESPNGSEKSETLSN